MSIRTIRTSVIAIAAAGVLAAGGLLAGRVLGGSLNGGSGYPGGFGAGRLFGRMAKALDLTDDQKARIKEILGSHGPEIEAQMKTGGEARRRLHEAVMADPIDEAAIRARAEELGRAHGDGALLFARIRAEIVPILTAEQKQKLEQMRARMHERGRHAVRDFSDFLHRDSQ
jgi:protein CpxP